MSVGGRRQSSGSNFVTPNKNAILLARREGCIVNHLWTGHRERRNQKAFPLKGSADRAGGCSSISLLGRVSSVDTESEVRISGANRDRSENPGTWIAESPDRGQNHTPSSRVWCSVSRGVKAQSVNPD